MTEATWPLIIGGFITLLAPAIGRLHTIGGIIALVAGVITMCFGGAQLCAALGIAGVIAIGGAYTTHKITGEVIIIDIVQYIAGFILIISGFFFV
jgi:hypothetical protein